MSAVGRRKEGCHEAVALIFVPVAKFLLMNRFSARSLNARSSSLLFLHACFCVKRHGPRPGVLGSRAFRRSFEGVGQKAMIQF